MKPNEMLAKAISIASTEFQSKMDRGGTPYIMHCLAVMDGVKHLGFEVMTAAVLHDLIEDIHTWNAERLAKEGFSDWVIQLVKILTHLEGEDYLSYIGRVSILEETKAIKLSDLRHNMHPERLPDLSDKTMERMRKYHTAYYFLLGKK